MKDKNSLQCDPGRFLTVLVTKAEAYTVYSKFDTVVNLW